jgi:hypothetical protein
LTAPRLALEYNLSKRVKRRPGQHRLLLEDLKVLNDEDIEDLAHILLDPGLAVLCLEQESLLEQEVGGEGVVVLGPELEATRGGAVG